MKAQHLIAQGFGSEFSNEKKYRNSEHQEVDNKEALRRGQDERARDWPNEAGFQALHEETSPVRLPIEGYFPWYTAGVLFRTGPGSWKIGENAENNFTCSHWFDGFAHSHRFELIPPSAGAPITEVVYTSRSQSKPLIEALRKNGDRGMSFGQRRDPCVGIFGKVMSIFKSKAVPRPIEQSNIGVTVIPNYPSLNKGFKDRGGRFEAGRSPVISNVWLATDSSIMKEMDPNTLEIIDCSSQSKLNPELSGPISCAHTQRDHLNGDVYNFNLSFGKEAVYKVFRVSAATGETKILANLSGPGILPAYIHSFFMTEDFVILAIWNSHFGLNGLKIMWEQNMLDGIDPFDSSKPVKWLVIDRKHDKGLVAEFESDAAFSFHSINAWQESGKNGSTDITCDVVCYDTLDILHSLYYSNIRSSGEGAITFASEKGNSSRNHLVRFKLTGIDARQTLTRNPGSLIPRAEKLFTIHSPHSGELPTINPTYSTRPSRYVYGIVNRGYSVFLDGISKVDTETKAITYWNNSFGHTPGEAIFVPDPDGKKEDDGVLLSVVLNGIAGTSYLLCLDARTMEEIGKAEVGNAVGFGFHGSFVN